MPFFDLLLCGTLSLSLGGLGAWFMSRYAFTLGLIDVPNIRSSHSRPTPRGGGIGILLAMAAAGLILAVPPAAWLTAFLLGVASLFDDRLGLSARTRLLMQTVCAAVAFAATGLAPATGWALIVLLATFGLIYIVGTANFFNFMDGINGIAGIAGVLAFGALGVFSWMNGYPANELLFNVAIAIACLGFLPFNFPRARVFMGDVGSVSLGFLFAVQTWRYSHSVIEHLFLSGFLFMLFADALTTFFIRWFSGERLAQAHRRHLYQLLTNQLGKPHWQISLGYGGAQMLVSLALFNFYRFGFYGVSLVLGLAFGSFCLLSYAVRVHLSNESQSVESFLMTLEHPSPGEKRQLETTTPEEKVVGE